jgi:transcriptional regulator with XRE-family HTH domain
MARAIATGPTGSQLRKARREARLTAAAIAAVLGVTHQRVFNLEAMRRVSPDAGVRYLAAVRSVAERDGRQ